MLLEAVLPGAELVAQGEIVLRARDVLTSRETGILAAIGLDHFARPGSRLARAAAERRMIRTFQGYVEHRADTILGMGVSAISSTPRMHWQNHAELPAWGDAIERRELPIVRGIELDADDRVRRAVIGQLMCDGQADLDQIGGAHGIDAAAYFAGPGLAASGDTPREPVP